MSKNKTNKPSFIDRLKGEGSVGEVNVSMGYENPEIEHDNGVAEYENLTADMPTEEEYKAIEHSQQGADIATQGPAEAEPFTPETPAVIEGQAAAVVDEFETADVKDVLRDVREILEEYEHINKLTSPGRSKSVRIFLSTLTSV